MSFIHIYCDESGKHRQHAVVSFSALCIREEALADFDSRWKGLLRQYDLTELHMTDVACLRKKVGSKFERGQSAAERSLLLEPFADCINDLAENGLASVWDSKGIAAIPEKQIKALASIKNPHILAFLTSLQMIATYGHDDDRIAMFVDDDEETAFDCYRIYRKLRKISVHARKKVKSITFADSETFPAIQAADMVCYLSRMLGISRWFNKPNDFEPLLRYLTTNDRPGKATWKLCLADENALTNSKHWRTK